MKTKRDKIINILEGHFLENVGIKEKIADQILELEKQEDGLDRFGKFLKKHNVKDGKIQKEPYRISTPFFDNNAAENFGVIKQEPDLSKCTCWSQDKHLPNCPLYREPQKKIEKIIDLPELKKYITKCIGKRCTEQMYGCMICQAWRTYDDLKVLIDSVEWPDEEDFDLKDECI